MCISINEMSIDFSSRQSQYFFYILYFLLMERLLFVKFYLSIYLYKDTNKRHPGHDMLYEYHSNQSGDPDNVLVHCLGHWRLSQLFHDLVFHPKIVVYLLLSQKKLKNIGKMAKHDKYFHKISPSFLNNNIFSVKYFKFQSLKLSDYVP